MKRCREAQRSKTSVEMVPAGASWSKLVKAGAALISLTALGQGRLGASRDALS